MSNRARRFSVAYVRVRCCLVGWWVGTYHYCFPSHSNESFQAKIDVSAASEVVDEPPYIEKTEEQRAFITSAVRVGWSKAGPLSHFQLFGHPPAWKLYAPPKAGLVWQSLPLQDTSA